MAPPPFLSLIVLLIKDPWIDITVNILCPPICFREALLHEVRGAKPKIWQVLNFHAENNCPSPVNARLSVWADKSTHRIGALSGPFQVSWTDPLFEGQGHRDQWREVAGVKPSCDEITGWPTQSSSSSLHLCRNHCTSFLNSLISRPPTLIPSNEFSTPQPEPALEIENASFYFQHKIVGSTNLCLALTTCQAQCQGRVSVSE